MKRIIKRVSKSKVTATPTVEVTSEVTSTLEEVKREIEKLTIGFPDEGLNKLVEKINEIIDHKCH